MAEKTVIILRESLMQSIISDAITFGSTAAFIGVGVYMQSTPMQWFGAFFAFVSILSRASGKTKRFTVAEAQAYLRTLDAN